MTANNTISVRPFAERDRAAVVQIWNTVFAEDPAWNEPNLVIDTKLKVQPQMFFVAELSGEVVGTTLAGFDGFRGWVHHVAVSPEQQHQGVAQQMLATAEHALVQMGCRKLNLQVRAKNTAAASFYQGLGFVEEDRRSFGKLLGGDTET